jgi:hypothetical protein
MTKVQTSAGEKQHGLMPLINSLFTRLHPHSNNGLLPFEGTDAHTEQDIGFHHDGRPHERDEWRF